MALDLGDLNAFLDPTMTFRWEGKQYTIPPVSAALGIWGKKVAALRDDPLEPDASPEEIAAVATAAAAEIGPPPIPKGQTEEEGFLSPGLVAELVADGVPFAAIKHLAETVYAQIIGGDKFALAVFEGNLNGPANRKERRAAKKATPKTSSSRTTSTAGAATTRKPASGNATKFQPAAKVAKAPALRGGKS